MNEEYKKFGELTRDEQLELVNHVLDGGDVEIFSGSWKDVEMVKVGCICFYEGYAYRKLKTEIEILKEEYEKIGKKIEEMEGIDHSIKVGDYVRYKNSSSNKTYEVMPAYLYQELPFIVDGYFFSERKLNSTFIKVS